MHIWFLVHFLDRLGLSKVISKYPWRIFHAIFSISKDFLIKGGTQEVLLAKVKLPRAFMGEIDFFRIFPFIVH